VWARGGVRLLRVPRRARSARGRSSKELAAISALIAASAGSGTAWRMNAAPILVARVSGACGSRSPAGGVICACLSDAKLAAVDEGLLVPARMKRTTSTAHPVWVATVGD
jgi:hypothetical protein